MLKNLSRKTILANRFRLCKTRWSQAWGLMFSQRTKALVMVFHSPARPSLHMLFVFFPIDVLCLDALKRVVDLKENFRPWTFWRSKALCSYIVELPVGSIGRSQTRIADFIEFKDKTLGARLSTGWPPALGRT